MGANDLGVGGAMHSKDAWAVLGLPYNATPLQVKAAYKQKALQNHPDRFPSEVKLEAEARFKNISEAYNLLKSGSQAHGGRSQQSSSSGFAWAHRGKRVHTLVASMPFALLIVGTLTLGLSRASRAYQRQQQESPARNPFLP